MTNGNASTSNVFELFDVGFYADPLKTGVAPPFVIPPNGQAYIDSQRYWQKCQLATGLAVAGQPGAQRTTIMLQTMMRASPAAALVGTMRSWDIATAPNLSSYQANVCNQYVAEFNFNTSANMTLGRCALIIDANNSTIYQSLNARL